MYDLLTRVDFFPNTLDYGISKEEFVRMQKEDYYHRLGEEMTPEFLEITSLRFQHTDTDQSGYIDWDEYLNYECTRRIYRMSNVTISDFTYMCVCVCV